jgi:hypothetical protein
MSYHLPLRRLWALSLCILGCSSNKNDNAPEDPPKSSPVASEPTPVPQVDSIKCAINKSNPPELVVTAYGTVPKSGWTDEQLEPRQYTTPPADSTWDYDFSARRPEAGGDIMTPIQAEHRWPDYPARDLRGVRVHGVGAGVKESTVRDCNKP